MSIVILLASTVLVLTLSLHLGSAAIAILRCRLRPVRAPACNDPRAVSIVRPVCGLENFIEETLRSSFMLDHARLELLFCFAREDDTALPLVHRLVAEYPGVDARILVGETRISANPKLNNMFKGWREARHPYVVFADSNVLMPPDYVQRLLAGFRPDTALVCSPPVGIAPQNLWAEVECAFLNAYQARWQYFADTLGLGFAQGKNMMWRHDDLLRAGGVPALACEAAEDAASTKVVRAMGQRVRLVERPFPQPLGQRGLKDVWKRQLRWAQLRRASFPLYFVPEIFTGALVPLAAALALAGALELPVLPPALLLLVIWYGAELALALAAGWPASARSILAAVLRDLMIPLVWLRAWSDTGFVWRGNAMTATNTEATATSGHG